MNRPRKRTKEWERRAAAIGREVAEVLRGGKHDLVPMEFTEAELHVLAGIAYTAACKVLRAPAPATWAKRRPFVERKA